MAGNTQGSLKAAETNKRKYGADYYQKIGAKGGKFKGRKGFAAISKERLIEISRMGGEAKHSK